MASVDDDGALEERFGRAAERMRQNTSLVLSNESKLELYGYFKQVGQPEACTCRFNIIFGDQPSYDSFMNTPNFFLSALNSSVHIIYLG